ncbi:MAG: prolipoprotein diacylglyceryl transferase [Planctomycetota bacterium]
MLQTLFYLPHAIGPLPVVGLVSWVMLGMVLYATLMIAMSGTKADPWRGLREDFLGWCIWGGIVTFMFGVFAPQFETTMFAGTPEEVRLGVPIRGYGVMVVIGIFCAVQIASRRIHQLGISDDAFFVLLVLVVVSGMLGARLFYVVQKWNELEGTTFREKLGVALKFTEGGLVVYGSVLGAMVVILAWTLWNRVRPIPLFDAVVPAFFIGLAFGRIGCLLNGCCFGGVCESHLPSIAFPPGAPAYMDQLEHGRLLGMRTRKGSGDSREIESVDANGWAASRGLKAGQVLDDMKIIILPPPPDKPTASPEFVASLIVDGKRMEVPVQAFPKRSLPVHPSQIYASISGLLLCLWTLSIAPWVQRPGFVFGAGLVGYGIIRILEEIIRVDEQGVFGTPLSISQWISVLGIVAGLVILFWSFRYGFRPQVPITTT